MTASNIQLKVWRGYAIAAQHLGASYAQYRASSVTNPTATGNLVQSLDVAFDDNPNYQFGRPLLYGHGEKFALVDGSQVQQGDYIVGGDGTYFISEIRNLLPIVAVICNVTLNILRPASNTGFGVQAYGGDNVGSETPVMTGWPAWVMQGTKGEHGDTNLPGDVRMPWFVVWLPAYQAVQIEAADVLYDNDSRRFKVSSAELSPLGWRLTAMLADT